MAALIRQIDATLEKVMLHLALRHRAVRGVHRRHARKLPRVTQDFKPRVLCGLNSLRARRSAAVVRGLPSGIASGRLRGRGSTLLAISPFPSTILPRDTAQLQ